MRLIRCALLVLLVLSQWAWAYNLDTNPLKLSPEEITWLAKNPTMRFTGDPNWLPYEAFDEQDNYTGIVSKFLHDFESKTGLKIEYVPVRDWQEALYLAKNGKVDIFTSDLNDEIVSNTYIFSNYYLQNALVVLSKQTGSQITDLIQLGHDQIGILRDYGYTKALVDKYPFSSFTKVDDLQDGLNKLISGDIDYFVATSAISQFHLANDRYPDINIRGQLPLTMDLAFAVVKNEPLLLSIINKWIASLSTAQRYQLAETWYLENTEFFSKTTVNWQYVITLAGVIVVILIAMFFVWRSRQTIAAKEERFKQVLQAVDAGEWVFNLENQQLHISPQFLSSLPISIPHTIECNDDFLVLIDAKYRHLWSDSLESIKASEAESVELELRMAQDKSVWIALKGRIQLIKKRRTLLGTMENISSLKKAELISQQQQQLVSVLFDSLPDPIILDNHLGQQRISNSAYANYFGQQPLADVIAKNERVRWQESEDKVLQEKQKQRFAGWLNIENEKVTGYFDVIRQPFFDEYNEVNGILSVARDITEPHKLTQQLEQFHRFAQYSQQGFGIANFDTEVTYINPKMLSWIFGDEQAVCPKGTTFKQFYPIELHEKLINEVMPAILQTGLWQGELAIQLNDGTQLPTFETLFLLRDEDGTPLYIGDVLVDISQQKQVEATLEHAKREAESANASKSIFLANMSHEIRTPLNAILGYAQLLSRNSQIDSSVKTQVDRIYSAGQRLLSLINDILDLSKIEAGKLRINNSLFCLYDELADVVKICRVKANQKQLELRSDIQIDPHEYVICDKTKLGQVLLNVIDNAIKFTETGSVAVKLFRQDKLVTFEIQDTGIGISEEELGRLFQPFSQGVGGANFGGTGLGLVLSRRIVEAMGGRFELTSALNIGTTIRISLELEKLDMEATRTSEVEDFSSHFALPAAQTKTALIIEDDLFSQDLLNQMLTGIGFETTLCDDGLLGLEYLKTHTAPDIIFTDIRMPNLDGVEMLNRMRQMGIQQAVPIVAVSASSLDHERRFYLEQGFSDFVAKPVDFRQLISTIKHHLHVQFEQVVTEGKIDEKQPNQNESSIDVSTDTDTSELIREISEAAAFGDIDIIAEKLSVLLSHPDWQSLKSEFDAALANYDFDRIVDLVS